MWNHLVFRHFLKRKTWERSVGVGCMSFPLNYDWWVIVWWTKACTSWSSGNIIQHFHRATNRAEFLSVNCMFHLLATTCGKHIDGRGIITWWQTYQQSNKCFENDLSTMKNNAENLHVESSWLHNFQHEAFEGFLIYHCILIRRPVATGFSVIQLRNWTSWKHEKKHPDGWCHSRLYQVLYGPHGIPMVFLS